jgi:hypothetical protein
MNALRFLSKIEIEIEMMEAYLNPPSSCRSLAISDLQDLELAYSNLINGKEESLDTSIASLRKSQSAEVLKSPADNLASLTFFERRNKQLLNLKMKETII